MGEEIRCVLVADDDEALLKSFESSLPRKGITAYTATSREAALELARVHKPQAALVDLHLGFDNGLDLLRDLVSEDPTMRVIVLSGYASVRATVDAMRLGAADVLSKPCTMAEIFDSISGARASGELSDTPSAERVLWEHVHRVLADCGGNKSEASRRLRKPRTWLRRFLARRPPEN